MRLIDADKLKEFIHRDNILSRPSDFDDNKRHIREMLSYVDFQPTIEAEPVKHGHWIKVDEEYNKCSICGNLHHYLESYGYYCQHCGAKMNEVEEWEV